MALKMNFREVTPEDTEILRMIALRNGKAEDYLCCDVTNEDGVTQTTWYTRNFSGPCCGSWQPAFPRRMSGPICAGADAAPCFPGGMDWTTR